MLYLPGIFPAVMLGLTPTGGGAAEGAELVDVRRIWDRAPHNAFTDLLRFEGAWYCVFREGEGHVSPDGALRVIASPDGMAWEAAALLTSPTSDLRDAKLTVTPEGRLMLCGAEARHNQDEGLQSLAWFSSDGRNWSDACEIGDRNFWLWRTTWHKSRAYAIGYGCREQQGSLRLYVSEDGMDFRTHVETLLEGSYPNETSVLFMEDDTAYCLLRRDAGTCTGLIGASRPPYTDWEWKDLGVRIGGPHMIRLPDGRFVAAVRLYDEPVRTSLCWLDPVAGTLEEFLKLPSGGDTSYPGLLWHEGLLWVSYYASHEEKTSIYLARVRFDGM